MTSPQTIADGSIVRVGEIVAEKYRVERVIGEGGMGIVVAATHMQLETRVALKLMRPDARRDKKAVKRFEREARTTAKLTSEHVARVLDVGRLKNGSPFIVMEHLEGSDLGALLARRRVIPLEDAALYVLHACDALAEAHARGVIHRDLKPANLFLTRASDGSPLVKVLDFGISKTMSFPSSAADTELTGENAMVGTLHYMAPEQAGSTRDVDARADIWSLGVILYELVTGRRPFDDAKPSLIFAKVQLSSPEPPSAKSASVPAALDAIILRCLEKDPGARFADVAHLASALLPFAPASAQRLSPRIVQLGAAERATIKFSTSIEPVAAPTFSGLRPERDEPPEPPATQSMDTQARWPPRRAAMAALAGIVASTGLTALLLRDAPAPSRPLPSGAAPAEASPPSAFDPQPVGSTQPREARDAGWPDDAGTEDAIATGTATATTIANAVTDASAGKPIRAAPTKILMSPRPAPHTSSPPSASTSVPTPSTSSAPAHRDSYRGIRTDI